MWFGLMLPNGWWSSWFSHDFWMCVVSVRRSWAVLGSSVTSRVFEILALNLIILSKGLCSNCYPTISRKWPCRKKKKLSCFRKLAVERLANAGVEPGCFCRPVWNELAGESDYFLYLFASFKDYPVFKLPNQTHTDVFPNYFPRSGQKRISHEAPPFWTKHPDHAKVKTHLKHVSQC